MKDLYKRIGLPSQTDNVDEIINALNNSGASFKDKDSVQCVLLDAQRKTVYDRNHKLLKTIGQVRANIGLNRTPLWLSVDCHDFDCEPMVPIEKVQLRENSSFVVVFFSGLRRLVLALLYYLIVWGLIIGVLVMIGFIVDSCVNNTKTKSYDRPTSSYSYEVPKSTQHREPTESVIVLKESDKHNAYTSSPKDYQKTEIPLRLDPQISMIEFNEPVQLLPLNGFTERYHSSEAIAPFEIRTRYGSGNYYVKMVDYYTKKTVLTIFVRDGQSVNIDVPLGTYELKYAVGKNWYGNEHLFGPDTACSKAKDRFEFERHGDEITGYTVELYLQINGNLETNTIPVSSF